MYNTIIVDDEAHCIERLKELLSEEWSHKFQVLASFSSVEEAQKNIPSLNPDLLFLDVQIHEKTGFDLLRNLRPIKMPVIFTTAYDKFAVEAFRFSALDYLLKPVDKDDLSVALEKFQESAAYQNADKRIEVLLANLALLGNSGKRIMIPNTNGFEIVNTDDILRCESQINYTHIHLRDKSKMLVAKTLKEFEDMLKPYGFCRLHNSHLVNLSCIKSYNKGKGGAVILSDGTYIQVSTRRKEELMRMLAGSASSSH
jgi:two-component system LytT family response regulator